MWPRRSCRVYSLSSSASWTSVKFCRNSVSTYLPWFCNFFKIAAFSLKSLWTYYVALIIYLILSLLDLHKQQEDWIVFIFPNISVSDYVCLVLPIKSIHLSAHTSPQELVLVAIHPVHKDFFYEAHSLWNERHLLSSCS